MPTEVPLNDSTPPQSSEAITPKAKAVAKKIPAPVLQRSRRDWIACGVITAVAILGVLGVFLTAPIRNSTLSVANADYTEGAQIPLIGETYHEAWRAPADSINHAPLALNGLVISTNQGDDSTTIQALDASNGAVVWTYTRDVPLCSLSKAWGTIVADFRTGVGCGDVVSINSASGTYHSTRSSLASTDVVPISSNDRVGIVSQERVELWRSDLVRTVEYGDVPAKAEPAQQPHEECEISSALTRQELLAVVEACPGEDNTYEYVRLQKTTPEESRKPEISSDIALPGTGNEIVAIGESAVALYSPERSSIMTYNTKGQMTHEHAVSESPLVHDHKGVFGAQVADLPHNMTWFDGKRLYLFLPSTMTVSQEFDDAIGTGIALSEQLIYPTESGLNVADWDTGKVIRKIPVDRNGYSGPVSLGFTGNTIIEKRGNELVGLMPF